MYPEKVSRDPDNIFSGEREIGTRHDDFSRDHVNRYRFVEYFVRPGDTILDAACGVGYGSAMLSEKASLVAGMDYNAEAISYANKHWQRPNIDFRQGDLRDSEAYPGILFSKIVSFETIEHLKDDRSFLALLARHLAPNGVLYISSPNADVIDVHDNPWHVRHYKPSEFRRLLLEYFSKVAEFTQIDNGVRWGRGGDNNIIVCSNHSWYLAGILIWNIHGALYRLKCRLLKIFHRSRKW